jgi:hypothetical protein
LATGPHAYSRLLVNLATKGVNRRSNLGLTHF